MSGWVFTDEERDLILATTETTCDVFFVTHLAERGVDHYTITIGEKKFPNDGWNPDASNAYWKALLSIVERGLAKFAPQSKTNQWSLTESGKTVAKLEKQALGQGDSATGEH